MLIQGKYRCINCFTDLNNENDKCSCGFDESTYVVAPHYLKPGTIINDTYCIGHVIGEGGFGITYVGLDINLEKRVAIKEFYMNGYNSRVNTVSDDISVSYGDTQKLFEDYKEKFVNEARILAKFDHEESIVSVHSFFEANNTAYIVMQYLDGQNLKEYSKSRGKMSVEEVLRIFLPIMHTLDKVHGMNLIHRDISPDNIIFTKNGEIKLLDFGAARELSDENKSLSVLLKHGYAPPEQYKRHSKQGPWTDIYAISATMYKCLTGKTPVEAIDRLMGAELVPLYEIADCHKAVSDVIMKGLDIRIENRYNSMGEMADALLKASELRGTDKADDTDFWPGENIIPVIYGPPDMLERTQPISGTGEFAEKSADVKKTAEPTKGSEKKTGLNNYSKESKRHRVVLIAILLVILILLVSLLLPVLISGIFDNSSSEAANIEVNNGSSTEVTNTENINVEESVGIDINNASVEDIMAQDQANNDESNIVEEDIETEDNITKLSSASVGDTITFGEIEQNNILKEAIEWIVLDKQDDKILVTSKYAIASKAYGGTSWAASSVRMWLNGRFKDVSFSDDEKLRIVLTDTEKGVQDKLFILSVQEVQKYFDSNESRICAITGHAGKEYIVLSEGKNIYSDEPLEKGAPCLWWLRTTGSSNENSNIVGNRIYFSTSLNAVVDVDGTVNTSGVQSSNSSVGVRPAMWIKID